MGFRDERKTQLSVVFTALRKAKGLTQNQLSAASGVERSAIAQFEAGRASLSNVSLQNIAFFLNINPAFVVDRDIYPFASGQDEVIRLYLPESRLTGALDYSMLYFLAGLRGNASLAFLFLSPNVSAARIANPFDRSIYAVTVRDALDNIFLFRRRIGSPLWGNITGERELQLEITRLAQQARTHVSFDLIDIDTRHYEAIRQWNITRDDLESLFPDPSEAERIIPTLDEIALLELLRDRNITAREAMDILLRNGENNREE